MLKGKGGAAEGGRKRVLAERKEGGQTCINCCARAVVILPISAVEPAALCRRPDLRLTQ